MHVIMIYIFDRLENKSKLLPHKDLKIIFLAIELQLLKLLKS